LDFQSFALPFDAALHRFTPPGANTATPPPVRGNSNQLPKIGIINLSIRTKIVEEPAAPEVMLPSKPPLPSFSSSNNNYYNSSPTKTTKKTVPVPVKPVILSDASPFLHYEDPHGAAMPNKEMRALLLAQRTYFGIQPILK
jgi:hypothetical protein